MKIGGTTRDSLMTLIPIAVTLIVASILLGGPEDGLRFVEQAAQSAWNAVVLSIRHDKGEGLTQEVYALCLMPYALCLLPFASVVPEAPAHPV